MSIGWLLNLLLAICMQTSLAQNQYCSITPQHTLCKNSGLGPACMNRLYQQGVTKEDAKLILHYHNNYRKKVANGKEKRGAPGPQPQAANMRKMEWDDELASVAQSHANQCVFKHDCNDCRRVARFRVGQNLYVSSQSNFDNTIDWPKALNKFYNEVSKFNRNTIKSFKSSSGTGHYTQMMWASTVKIGCGFTMYKEGSWYNKLYTCNYGPAGNSKRREIYQVGTPCTACPRGTTCSGAYPGLCYG